MLDDFDRVVVFDLVDELDFLGASFFRSVVVERRLLVVVDRVDRDGVAEVLARVVVEREEFVDGYTRRFV